MTATQIRQANMLARCTFAPATTAKRFARWVGDIAKTEPERELTAKAAVFLNRLAHSYRKQIGVCLAENCEKCRRPR